MTGRKPMRMLVSAREINRIVARMARQINRHYRGRKIIVIGVLKGSVVFMGDLIRKLKMPLELDFVEVSSYTGTTSSGKVKIKKPISVDLKGRDVLVVEDIVDTGITISAIRKLILKQKPRSLKIATFLSKPSCRKVKMRIDFVGRKIPNKFVIGYGLDYDGAFRNLPAVMNIQD